MTEFPKQTDCRYAAHLSVKRVRDGIADRISDAVAVEEPLAIHLTYWSKEKRLTESLAVTMRTPGHDLELAVGYLLSEGVVTKRDDVVDLHTLGAGETNEVRVELERHVDVDTWRLTRTGMVGSACGICGKRLFESMLETAAAPVNREGLQIDSRFIARMPVLLRDKQQAFSETGGLHAAALISLEGTLESVFEDVGRHNALDKVIGHALLSDQIPLRDKVLFLSSRGSYELVQKVAVAGAPILATVGGPSSLAVQAARHYGMTLLGFVRDHRFNIYAGDWRVRL
jgi:FdhD protein